MDNALKIVSTIRAKSGQGEFVKTEVAKVIDACRQHEGCLQFDVLVDMEDPDNMFLYQKWESRGHWLAHMSSSDVRSCIVNSQEYVLTINLHETQDVLPYTPEPDEED